MDPSSVITQASPDSNNDGSHIFNNVQKDSKKKRNFLCSIICCLGKKGNKFKGSKNDSSNSSSAKGAGGHGSKANSSSNGDQTDQKSNSQNKSNHLLPEVRESATGKRCIVIDLDETLVHSSFKPISNADFIVPVEIDNVIHQVYVLKRPFVDEFLVKVGELFECVLFTASLAKYADPVADLLDKWDVFHSRLFRESCVFHKGNYVKDLSKLGRDLPHVIIVDNSPASYIFHPENALPVASWFDDMNDRELLDLIPLLEQLSNVDNSVYRLLKEATSKSEQQHSFKKPSQTVMPPPPPPSGAAPAVPSSVVVVQAQQPMSSSTAAAVS